MKFRTLLLAAAASTLMGSAAFAADEPAPPYTLTFNVGAASDYVFRGISQTDEDPQVFGGADLAVGQFYAGAWASNVSFKAFGDRKTDAEVDFYGGWKGSFSGLNLDIGGIYYAYLGNPAHTEYGEIYGKGSYAFGPLTVGAALFWSPEFPAQSGDAWYYEANAAYTVDKWTVSGALGHQDIEKAADYTTWNAGVSYAINSHLLVDARYWDTNAHDFADIYGARGVVSLKVMF
jgi:uncharacterized protein (TIGR02001 family)